MKRGDKVKIYQSWLDSKDFEGSAELVEFVRQDKISETWMVRFGDEDAEYERRILKLETKEE